MRSYRRNWFLTPEQELMQEEREMLARFTARMERMEREAKRKLKSSKPSISEFLPSMPISSSTLPSTTLPPSALPPTTLSSATLPPTTLPSFTLPSGLPTTLPSITSLATSPSTTPLTIISTAPSPPSEEKKITITSASSRLPSPSLESLPLPTPVPLSAPSKLLTPSTALEEFHSLLKFKRPTFIKEEWYDNKNTTEDEAKTCQCILDLASDDYFSGGRTTSAFRICPGRIARGNRVREEELRRAVFSPKYLSGARDVCTRYANFSKFPTEYLYTSARLKGYHKIDINNFIKDPEKWRQTLLNYLSTI